MNSTKVRPMILLWALLVCHIAITLCFVGWGLNEGRKASAFIASNSAFYVAAKKAKAQAQSEQNIEQLRSWALRDIDMSMSRVSEDVSKLQQISEVILLASLIPAVTSAALAYAMYGLRIKNAQFNQKVVVNFE